MSKVMDDLKQLLPVALVVLTLTAVTHLAALVGFGDDFEASWVKFWVSLVALIIVMVINIRCLSTGA